MTNYHVPVMLEECLKGLNIKPNGVYVDTTYGGGGHAKAILNQLGDDGILLVFDQDADAVKNRVDDPRMIFCHANFGYLQNFCAYYRLDKIDGLLADLGISSHQIDEGERGFSYRFEQAELDMRMNSSSGLSAIDVLNSYSQDQLATVLQDYGELRSGFSMAGAICDYRKLNRIEQVQDMERALEGFLSTKNKSKILAQVYQAIRIEVNQEIEVLKEMLVQASDLLANEGRLVVLSYHSLEDRLVKNLIQSGNLKGERQVDAFGKWTPLYKAINRKPITASEEELKANSRARSAKLRIAERIK